MNFYITSGTSDFMEKLITKFKKEAMYILYGIGETLLLHETEKKTVFQTPRKYEVIGKRNEIEQTGFFVLHHIPISDEGRPVFERYFLERIQGIEKKPGFIAFRLLRPKKSETYIFLSQWTSKNSYEVWVKSSPTMNALGSETVGVKKDNIFNAAIYTTTYSGVRPEKKDEKVPSNK